MASVKATFTLDGDTMRELALAAERTGKPKSAVVREAIHDYSQRTDRVSERERLERLRVFDEVMAGPTTGSQAEADAEIAEIRAGRRAAGEHRADRLGE